MLQADLAHRLLAAIGGIIVEAEESFPARIVPTV
jgi:hypothetical protein